jgi:hypothetical protein
MKAVNTWLKNNKPYKERAVFRLERKIPLRRVVAKLEADRIDQMVREKDPDAQSGDQTYPGKFQKVLTKLMDGLSEQERSEYEKVREEWQEKGPPMDVQLR